MSRHYNDDDDEQYDEDEDADIQPSIPVPRSVLLQPLSPPPPVALFSNHNMKTSETNNNNYYSIQQLPKKEGFQEEEETQRVMQHESPSVVVVHSWKVAHLLTVPMFHPLECTAVVIKDNNNISLDEICSRISTFMRLHSISCSYPSDIPGRVNCLTPCLLKFSVQLWRQPKRGESSNNNEDENEGGVILEVSRIQGCTVGMQQLRNRLVFAVLTGKQEPLAQHQNVAGLAAAKCPTMSLALRESYEQFMLHSSTDDNEDVGDDTAVAAPSSASSNMATPGAPKEENSRHQQCKEAMLIAMKLLESNCVDQARLGMESLCVLTDPKSLCDVDANWVASAVVFGQGECGTKLQSTLTKYFDNVQRLDHVGGAAGIGRNMMMMMSFDDDSNGFLEYAQGCSFGIMHNFALLALKNSLETLAATTDAKEEESAKPKVDWNSTFWKTAIPALLYNMEVAEQRPHEASLAASCMGLLESCLEPTLILKNYSSCDRLLPIAMQAHKYGKMHHWMLERESEHLIQTIQQSVGGGGHGADASAALQSCHYSYRRR